MVKPYDSSKRRELRGKLVAVMDFRPLGKVYTLLPVPSRAIGAGAVHELISTADGHALARGEAVDVAVIGFVEFGVAGVLAPGDRLIIAGRDVGIIAGFEDSHAPNHMNIMVKTQTAITGIGLGISVEDDVRIVPYSSESIPAQPSSV